MDRDVELVHALPRDLAAGDLSIDDFVCYRDYTHVLSTAKLASLGWGSSDPDDAIADTVETHFDANVGGGKHHFPRARERAVLDRIDER